MNLDDLTQDELDELEQRYQDLDPKLLQVQTLVELQRIRYTLEHMAANGSMSESEREPVTMYECIRCGKEVPEDERENHAKSEHNWMDGITNIDSEFEPV